MIGSPTHKGDALSRYSDSFYEVRSTPTRPRAPRIHSSNRARVACVDYGCVYVMAHDVVACGASTYMAPYCCTPWNAAVEAMPSVR